MTEMKSKEPKGRVIYYDILNIAACIAVITLHHNGIVHTYSNTLRWKLALVAEVFAYWAVPIFLMISGATLMNYRKKYDTKTFFIKRFKRAVVPFLCWSCIVLIWKIGTDQLALNQYSVKTIIDALLNYKMENVYWFFPLLFSIYLFMPVISYLAEDRYRKCIKYIILVMFICQSVMPPILKLVGIQWNSNYGLPIHAYLIFVFLGYYLSKTDLTKHQRIMIYLAGICGIVIRYAGIYLLSTRDGEKNTLFFNYGYFPSVMLACAVFVLAKNINFKKIIEKLHIPYAIIQTMASCSLGIYLIHRIVMYYELQYLGIHFQITNETMLWRTVFILVTYLISLAIVWIVKKIPVLKELVP